MWLITTKQLPRSSLARHFATTRVASALAPPELLRLPSLTADEHHALARSWVDSFGLEDIPKDAYEVSYARSSGPGGQHVNKTNSKAVLRCDIHRAKGVWLPAFVIPALQNSTHYHAPSLIFHCQASRSAPQNLAQALDNLRETIIASGSDLVKGETSEAQKRRIRGLAEAEKRRRRDMKDRQKSKKESRRKDDY